MSELPLPFAGEPTEATDGPQDELPGTRNRAVVALLVAGVVAVAGVAGYFVFLSGGSDPAAETAVAQGPAATTTPSPEATSTTGATKAVKKSNRAIGNDPFEPLVVEPVAAVAGATGADGLPLADPGASSTPVPTLVPVPALPGATSAPTQTTAPTPVRTPTAQPAPGHQVKLLWVRSDNAAATLLVDGKRHSAVAEGEVFATSFRSLDYLSGDCGVFQYGDERFDLCQGDSVTLR